MAWEFLPLVPILALGAGAVGAFLAGRALRVRGGTAASLIALASLGVAFAAFLALYDPEGRTAAYAPFGEAVLRADGLAVLLGLVATGLAIAVTLYSLVRMWGEPFRAEFTALFLLMVMGVSGLGLAGDLFNLYVFFELMAIATYALVAYPRTKAEASEAGMKYLVMNAAGSLVALLGIGIVYLTSPARTLDLRVLASPANAMPPEAALLAAGLMIAGFGVKAAVVPMHTWLPDAYTSAPTGVTAMLGGIVTQAGLLAMVRGLSVLRVDPDVGMSYGLLMAFLAVLTMTVGNLTAMHQTDLKRMLAYSSVAQVGYVLLGFGVGLELGVAIAVTGAVFHIVNHALMKGGAFLATGALERTFGTRDLAALRGVARRAPALGFAFGVFVLGLAGVPPTAGFLSKLLIATGAAQGGALGVFFVVALIGNSILSLAYYVPALTGLFSKEGAPPEGGRIPRGIAALLAVFAGLVLLFGLWPDLVLQFVNPAVRGILGGP